VQSADPDGDPDFPAGQLVQRTLRRLSTGSLPPTPSLGLRLKWAVDSHPDPGSLQDSLADHRQGRWGQKAYPCPLRLPRPEKCHVGSTAGRALNALLAIASVTPTVRRPVLSPHAGEERRGCSQTKFANVRSAIVPIWRKTIRDPAGW